MTDIWLFYDLGKNSSGPTFEIINFKRHKKTKNHGMGSGTTIRVANVEETHRRTIEKKFPINIYGHSSIMKLYLQERPLLPGDLKLCEYW